MMPSCGHYRLTGPPCNSVPSCDPACRRCWGYAVAVAIVSLLFLICNVNVSTLLLRSMRLVCYSAQSCRCWLFGEISKLVIAMQSLGYPARTPENLLKDNVS